MAMAKAVGVELGGERLGDDRELEELVRELDAILDIWFMAEVRPSLERASRARAEEPHPHPHRSPAPAGSALAFG